jgi:hypothetical protein
VGPEFMAPPIRTRPIAQDQSTSSAQTTQAASRGDI